MSLGVRINGCQIERRCFASDVPNVWWKTSTWEYACGPILPLEAMKAGFGRRLVASINTELGSSAVDQMSMRCVMQVLSIQWRDFESLPLLDVTYTQPSVLLRTKSPSMMPKYGKKTSLGIEHIHSWLSSRMRRHTALGLCARLSC